GIFQKQAMYHRARFCMLGISDEHLIRLGCTAISGDRKLHKGLSSFFERCKVGQKLADLIIPAEEKALLGLIINKCRDENAGDLSGWGFGAHSTNAKQGMVILLYGAPGTGKTFAAGAIANELKRDLVTLNVPELRNKYYGETEKLIKKAFAEMREMARQGSKAPIFLLNEADQLVHNRVSGDSTCSTIENTIQSIILEELETYPGILILTTNLQSNMDEAFFRRFDIKMSFALPDLACREQLWKMHLRAEIPGSGEIDIQHLAKTYRFSGAQIALVVRNACLAAIERKENRKILLTDLTKFADLELPWTKVMGKSIGF
ncbi:MAG: ATP-binding protein, partial [Candidatus Cloacimonadaceae bacterium]|nr:ATP-binding protein [Candidatus Cloacimonadaceae bacterium]